MAILTLYRAYCWEQGTWGELRLAYGFAPALQGLQLESESGT